MNKVEERSKKAIQLKENIENLLHYYETFLNDGRYLSVPSHKLLKESRELIHQIEEDIFNRLMELGYQDEAYDLCPTYEWKGW